MREHEEAMLKGLIAVAWADGKVTAREHALVEALIETFGVSSTAATALRAWAQTPRTLEDVPLTDLSADDRRLLLQHAVLVTHVDGSAAEAEIAFLDKLTERLRIPVAEATTLRAAAAERAKRLAAAFG